MLRHSIVSKIVHDILLFAMKSEMAIEIKPKVDIFVLFHLPFLNMGCISYSFCIVLLRLILVKFETYFIIITKNFKITNVIINIMDKLTSYLWRDLTNVIINIMGKLAITFGGT